MNLATGSHVARWLDAAEFLAKDTLTHRRAKILPCTTNDQACGEQFIAVMGLRAFRRPLTADERASLTRSSPPSTRPRASTAPSK